jgi:hypothetical protein
MTVSTATPFTDNWTYLKTELKWLERLLVAAVARRRQEEKDINRVAKSQADRVTSHWWQGLVVLDRQAAFDDCPAQAQALESAPSKQSYDQQLEAKIQVSQAQGLGLGLPMLCDRFCLSRFEKQVVLLALAPEVNRRYGRLYRYLQGDQPQPSDLPTVDLALRLFCRTDQDWCKARAQLAGASPLLEVGVLERVAQPEDTLLNQRLRVSSAWVNYLMADALTAQELTQLLQRSPASQSFKWQIQPPKTTWSDLRLPSGVRQVLQPLGQMFSLADRLPSQVGAGVVVLLRGSVGTGKTAVVEAIAHEAEMPLHCLDLATLSPQDYGDALQSLQLQSVPILLIKSAHYWFGRLGVRNPNLEAAVLQTWVEQRRQAPSLTFLSVTLPRTILPSWQQRCDAVVSLPLPQVSDRQQLWQAAFPPEVELDQAVAWDQLARQPLSGGEIQKIAQAATLQAIAMKSSITMAHIRQALAQRGYRLQRNGRVKCN